jgi:hypothetical protein
MTVTKTILTLMSLEAIRELGSCSKRQIKEKVLEIAEKKKALSKDFVLEFGDIGWRFIDLKEEGLITNNGLKGAKCRWIPV